MRVILTLNNYTSLTGSEIYVFELAKELSKRGHLVTILANKIGGEIADKTKKYSRIKAFQFFDHPPLPADLVLSSQPLPTTYALRFFSHPEICNFQILHSLFSYEEPIIDQHIKQYIAVRPEIHDYWLTKYPQLKKKMSTVWNGFDTTRFNEKDCTTPTHTIRLFIGTIDQLRHKVIEDLFQETINDPESKLWLVLPKDSFRPSKQFPTNITIFEPRWNTEGLVKQCSQTAGIFIGRTTIEGFLCGKPGLVYDVDKEGTIERKVTVSVPENRHIFDIDAMTNRILDLYNTHRYD